MGIGTHKCGVRCPLFASLSSFSSFFISFASHGPSPLPFDVSLWSIVPCPQLFQFTADLEDDTRSWVGWRQGDSVV